LKSDDPGRRWKAAESLARLGDERGVEPLIHALSDEDWRVRLKAAWALGYLGDPRAINPIRLAMRGESEGVREIMEEAIRSISSRMRGDEPAALW
jgi:HEAT repeat protein